MSRIPFEELPENARLWIFPADRDLTPAEKEQVLSRVASGLDGWAAHGSPVYWAQRINLDRFLMIGVDETRTGLTGCSIDFAVREIKTLEAETGLVFLDNSRVFYRDGEEIRTVSRDAFRKLAEEGSVSADTLVFNNVIATVGELQEGRWEIPVRDSWHARAFPVRA